LKRAHAPRLEGGPVGVIHLEIDGIVVDEREEEVFAIDADAAEHRAGADPRRHPAELLEHEGAERGADAHASTS
jgi:hypothetical protein